MVKPKTAAQRKAVAGLSRSKRGAKAEEKPADDTSDIEILSGGDSSGDEGNASDDSVKGSRSKSGGTKRKGQKSKSKPPAKSSAARNRRGVKAKKYSEDAEDSDESVESVEPPPPPPRASASSAKKKIVEIAFEKSENESDEGEDDVVVKEKVSKETTKSAASKKGGKKGKSAKAPASDAEEENSAEDKNDEDGEELPEVDDDEGGDRERKEETPEAKKPGKKGRPASKGKAAVKASPAKPPPPPSKKASSGAEEEEDEEEEVGDDRGRKEETPEAKKPGKKGRPPGKGKGAAKPPPTPSKKASSGAEDNEEEGEDGDDDQEWEVERLIETRMRKGTREFLVKWKGYNMTHATWEPEDNLQHCKELIDAFMDKLVHNNLSRTRRLSTIQSTKSSQGQQQSISSSAALPLSRTRDGRVSKSRSRTPLVLHSMPLRGSKLSSISQNKLGRDRSPPLSFTFTSQKLNGELPLQKWKRESVERKLEIIKADAKEKLRQQAAANSEAIPESEDEDDVVDGNQIKENLSSKKQQQEVQNKTTADGHRSRPRPRFGFGRKFVSGLGVVSLGAVGALMYTSPDAINWDSISPAVHTLLQTCQEKFQEIRSHTAELYNSYK